jgi:hypothetical protein
MTEEEWRNATDPTPLLRWLVTGKRFTERRSLLFGAACCRRVWDLMTDERCRVAVEVTERYVEGAVAKKDRNRAGEAARLVEDDGSDAVLGACTRAVCAIAEGGGAFWQRAWRAARAAADAKGHDAAWPAYRAGAVYYDFEAREVAREAERGSQCGLLRDLFGNPFRPLPTLDASLRMWNDSVVMSLAQAAYDERLLPRGTLDNRRLAVLADALEEGGLANQGLLAHLRSPGPHVRGCHGLDAVLGRS